MAKHKRKKRKCSEELFLWHGLAVCLMGMALVAVFGVTESPKGQRWLTAAEQHARRQEAKPVVLWRYARPGEMELASACPDPHDFACVLDVAGRLEKGFFR